MFSKNGLSVDCLIQSAKEYCADQGMNTIGITTKKCDIYFMIICYILCINSRVNSLYRDKVYKL